MIAVNEYHPAPLAASRDGTTCAATSVRESRDRISPAPWHASAAPSRGLPSGVPTMMKRTGLLGVIVLAMLASCSKTPPPDKTSVAEAAKAASTAAAATDSEQEVPPPATPQTEAAPPAPAIA